MLKPFCFALLAATGVLGATLSAPPNYTFSPWTPQTLVLNFSTPCSYASNQIIRLGAALGTAFDPFALEIGANGFHSKKTTFSFEDAYINGRMVLWDQNLGDPLTFAIGGQFSAVSSIAFRQKELFHFGNFESQIFSTLGSENFPSEFCTAWTSRWWLTAGAGIANRRSPWFIFESAYEIALCELKRVRLFAEGIIGKGDLQKEIQLGIAGNWDTLDYGGLDFSYGYRIYASHVEKKVSTFTLNYFYSY